MKSSYLKRMLLFIFISGMFPVVVFTVLLAVLIRFYQEVTNAYHKTTIDIQRYQIEEPLKYLEKTLIQLLSVNDMAYSIYYPRTEQYYIELMDARIQLPRIQTYSLNLSDIVFVSLRHNWVMDYSSFGPISMSRHKERIEAFSPVKDSSFWHYDREREHIYLVKKLPLNVADGDGMMIADFPVSSIDDLLSKSYADFPMVVADAAGVPMLGTTTNRLIVDTVQSSPKLWRSVSEKGITTVHFNGVVYVFTHVKSDYND